MIVDVMTGSHLKAKWDVEMTGSMKTARRVPSNDSSGAILRAYDHNYDNNHHADRFSRSSNPNFRRSYLVTQTTNQQSNVANKRVEKKDVSNVLCRYWKNGNCTYGDKCRYLHSWVHGDGFVKLTDLQGHKKAISGITLPSGSDKLFSASRDGTMRVWDCHTGQCTNVINLNAEVGSLISEGQWIIAGMPNLVKAWDIQTSKEYKIDGAVGQGHALEVGKNVLFAGAEDGTIWAWKPCVETSSFKLASILRGHSKQVVSLTIGIDRLYSGSMDHTIRVWDIESLQCVSMLNAHSATVTSLLCWRQFLLSASLDNTIKIWVASEDGTLEVTYTHSVEHGIISLAGMMDAEEKSMLFCACKDNSLRLYELPAFTERGRYFTRKEVTTIQTGPGGLFFTGDGSGNLGILKLTTTGKIKGT